MINLNEHSSLETLHSLPVWKTNEKLISAKPAGESNMNLVLRITTNLRSVILKQSKPYVRKFPQIPAPIERIEIEHTYYQLLQGDKILRKYSPGILLYYPKEHILLMEDLGNRSDFAVFYQSNINLNPEDVTSLSNYLHALHQLEITHFPDNSAMKRLNHEHIFHFPFMMENGFDLDSVQAGLQQISLEYKADSKLKQAIEKLGERYLTDGNTLLHGDFYPGSWLKAADGLKVIDPEFGFMGDREFDLGVLFAHLDLAQQGEDVKLAFLKQYQHPVSQELLNAYQGVEILRRLLGIAQLPVGLDLNQKKTLLEKAKTLILSL
ncbi:phosphotransferase [Algoriphagus sp. C2-6-M1]|uniref:phosphotransferase n=1 Tax=Algoriphagus persicinus TaxID=3108754 RepID=UPI002B3882B9|nr:phosphotransferase [Algoriphagus sp. C2-6-M1]MEB2779936.1 phosphotransferase [Algoriphagus sp. C2-6-M1]